MSEPVTGPDVDPSQWADSSVTYNAVASAYADAFLRELEDKPFDRDLLSRFADAIPRRAGSRQAVTCDLGCGPGHIGAFLAQRSQATVGIDLSSGMTAQARRHNPTLAFIQGDMTSLPLGDGVLVAVACFYALIHLARLVVPTALREIHRSLVKGGVVLMAVHGGAGTLHATEMLAQPANLDATLFTLDELSGLLEESGFDVVEAHERAPYAREHPTLRLYVCGIRRR
jgi:SAM-dependent methyltransferase